ncbi:MAG: MoxR family ATPase [Candidatus Delongbacteria bacterium]|nr:MoxR family ATPase [Candidatus Delongbacteria bacterium]
MTGEEIKKLNERINQESAFVEQIVQEVGKVIVGQSYMVERILIALLTKGHILLEGVPGLAKTLTISTFSKIIQADFHRLQFTPDLLPADLIGTLIYNQKTGEFVTQKGPIFSNLILADEINRAPAKVQSALLESMQEGQVTIGKETFPLPSLFLVMATQNPIEQEGTYPLPEAQIDRFMLKLKIDYPTRDEELQILKRMATSHNFGLEKIISPEKLVQAQKLVEEVYMDEKIERYIVDIVFATREPQNYKLNDIADFIAFGASPRASINLAKAARAHAFLHRRGYVIPEDVRAVGPDVLRHRILISYEAEAEGIVAEEIVIKILNNVEVP